MKPNIGQGDSGKTHLLGGKTANDKVRKDDPRIEACGALDELVAFIGVVRAHNAPPSLDVLLEQIQDHLFRIASHLSAAPDWENHPKLPFLGEDHIKFLEQEIVRYEEELPKLKNFILPSGTQLAAFLHQARTETRRVERKVVSASRKKKLHPYALGYLNRLSDLFFALARWVNYKENKEESIWIGSDKQSF